MKAGKGREREGKERGSNVRFVDAAATPGRGRQEERRPSHTTSMTLAYQTLSLWLMMMMMMMMMMMLGKGD